MPFFQHHHYHFTNRWFITVASVAILACNSVSYADDDRPANSSEIIDHLGEFPVDTARVVFIEEFMLKELSDSELQSSVENVYRQMDGIGKNDPVSDSFQKEVDREVKRMVSEQKVPRKLRMLERFNNSEPPQYRLDSIVARPGEDVVSADYKEAFVNIDKPLSDGFSSFRYDFRQRIAEKRGNKSQAIKRKRYWRLGSIGHLTISVLRIALKMPLDERTAQPDVSSVQDLTDGMLYQDGVPVSVTVRNENSATFGPCRKFSVSVDGNVLSTFLVSQQSFYPILETNTYAGDTLIENVKSFGVIPGERVPEGYTVNVPLAEDPSVRNRKVTLLEYTINEPIDPAVFKFQPPEGWAVVDYGAQTIQEPDGRSHGFNGSKISSHQPEAKSRLPLYILLALNAVVILFIVSVRRTSQRRTGGA